MFPKQIVFAYLLAVFVTFAAGSAAHTHFALNALGETGTAIPFGLRLQTMLDDMLGLAPGYGSTVAIALLIAFLAAWRIRRIFPVPIAITYPLAGAAGMAALLHGMTFVLGVPLIAGARTEAGFAAQCIAGAAGGLIFALALPRRNVT